MPLIHGEMQPFALTLDRILEHGAKWHPDAEVVTGRKGRVAGRIGYAGLYARARRLSSALAGCGVGAGDMVATLAWNTQAHVEAWYAVMGMGAVCHTLNPRMSEAHLAAMLAQSGARVLVVAADLLPMARRIAAQSGAVQRVLWIDDEPDAGVDNGGAEALERLLEQAVNEMPWGGFDENAPCGLCFTSGTTGAPKGVTYTHRGSFLHTLRALQADTMALSRRDSVLLAVPMFHANAWGVPFAAPAVGARLVLPGRHLDGESLAELIRAESVTVAIGVATVWLGLVEHLDAEGGDVPALSRVIVGGAPLAPALMQRIEQRLGVTVQTSWGMTELSPTGTVALPDDPQRAAHLSGRPSLGVDLLLTDADGTPLPRQRGGEGHLRVRGASTVQRYFGDATPAVDADGWFPTGDLARIDHDGNLVITGRAKDLIKSGGEWINPAEIEDIVGRVPGVSLAAVIGRAHPKWGERPVLLVEMHPGSPVREEALIEALHGKVASWWIPDEVIRLERMPLAATGKIDKMQLRAEFGGAQRRQEA
jgi:acyl-CoA synthetase (AMP-forming)/AMP-acid ligase II